MRMTLEQRQSLKMYMTTELRQAIELLQLSNVELKSFIEKQAEENPFIELVENDSAYSYGRSYSQKDPYDEAVDPLDFISNDEPSLYDHLLNQANLVKMAESKRRVLHFLILNLNESGYLPMTAAEVSQHLHVSEQFVEEARQVLLTFDPLGSGAYNLTESLLVQAKEKYPDDSTLHSLIAYDLENLANRKTRLISERLQIDESELAHYLKRIQTLQPKPAMNFSTARPNYVTPDIVVDLDEANNSFQIKLNSHYIPQIRFNRTYLEEVEETGEMKAYVNEQYKRFNWLKQSIEQRRQTILKIMDVVLRRQRGFFVEGFRGLKSLTLQDVALEIDMHESTVSRATANKIIETPMGTFELRKLFSTGLKSDSGDDLSQVKVKELLQEVIDSEDKAKPLSDQKIADQLKTAYGVSISRRTVAKYRDELNIPSSTRRKSLITSS